MILRLVNFADKRSLIIVDYSRLPKCGRYLFLPPSHGMEGPLPHDASIAEGIPSRR